MVFQTLFFSTFLEAGIEISPGNVEKFNAYLEELLRWNRKINLTGMIHAEEMVVKLFVDSAFAAPFVGEEKRVLDVGSGGGFPGMVLALMCPRSEVTLAESRQKKVVFLKRIRKVTGAKNVTIHGKRLEIPSRDDLGLFDVVISRAAGGTREMVTLGRPFLKEGGLMILMKGKDGELSGCPEAVQKEDYILPRGFGPRSLWIFDQQNRAT